MVRSDTVGEALFSFTKYIYLSLLRSRAQGVGGKHARIYIDSLASTALIQLNETIELRL